MQIAGPEFEAGKAMTLPANEVHLWRVELHAVAVGEARWQRVLSSDELERAKSFRFSRDQQYFIATRGLLRLLLGSYVGCDPEQLRFGYGEKRKPFLESCRASDPIEFNLSHSGSRALLAFTRGREVGVDIEQIRNNLDFEALARRFFSAAEQKELAALEPPKMRQGFFRCWTRKEAYIKATGAGLSLPLCEFDVSLGAGAENALIATRPNPGEAKLWSLREVAAGEGYVAALCTRGDAWQLKC